MGTEWTFRLVAQHLVEGLGVVRACGVSIAEGFRLRLVLSAVLFHVLLLPTSSLF